jgi:hypothetical protein
MMQPLPVSLPKTHHPEINLDYTWFKFAVLAYKFSVSLSREFYAKSAESLDESRPLSSDVAQN